MWVEVVFQPEHRRGGLQVPRPYTYWINGRLRPHRGDVVRVPTHDGADESEATVIRVVRDRAQLTYEGPFDEVICIVRRCGSANTRRASREPFPLSEEMIHDMAIAMDRPSPPVIVTDAWLSPDGARVERLQLSNARTLTVHVEDAVEIHGPEMAEARVTFSFWDPLPALARATSGRVRIIRGDGERTPWFEIAHDLHVWYDESVTRR